jgi:hypothetical protein
MVDAVLGAAAITDGMSEAIVTVVAGHGFIGVAADILGDSTSEVDDDAEGAAVAKLKAVVAGVNISVGLELETKVEAEVEAEVEAKVEA